MITAAQWRELALALAEAEERAHFEQPDFRVGNKIFCGLDRAQALGNLKLSPEAQRAAMEGNPQAFYPAAGVWGQRGWTHVVLRHASLAEVRMLMIEAYRSVAPKRLLTSLAKASR